VLVAVAAPAAAVAGLAARSRSRFDQFELDSLA
jgi:hypothetical protein